MGAVELFGPPGSGKSTLAEAVRKRGHRVYGWPGTFEARKPKGKWLEFRRVAIDILESSAHPERDHYIGQTLAAISRACRVEGQRCLVDEGVCQRALTVALALPGDFRAVERFCEAVPLSTPALHLTACLDDLDARNRRRGTHCFADVMPDLVKASDIAADIFGAVRIEPDAVKVSELLC